MVTNCIPQSQHCSTSRLLNQNWKCSWKKTRAAHLPWSCWFFLFELIPAGPVWYSFVTLERGALAGKAGKARALWAQLSYLPYLEEIGHQLNLAMPSRNMTLSCLAWFHRNVRSINAAAIVSEGEISSFWEWLMLSPYVSCSVIIYIVLLIL